MLAKQHPDNSVVKPKYGIPILLQSIRLMKSAMTPFQKTSCATIRSYLSKNKDMCHNQKGMIFQKIMVLYRFSCCIIFYHFLWTIVSKIGTDLDANLNKLQKWQNSPNRTKFCNTYSADLPLYKISTNDASLWDILAKGGRNSKS